MLDEEVKSLRRCSIYTRKSTDQSLDREVNSLVTQRELCAAFVKSQRARGWMELPNRYDDGGHSGSGIERPALTKLMQDIEAGEIDVVVVYKVDRLTRSLADFIRLVEIFDRYNVALVSISQSFDTADSMGRMVLNMLLTFSQFERELIADRVRDGILTRKKHGKWHGGGPPFGYVVKDGCLRIHDDEAQIVRFIFDEFLRAERYVAVTTKVRELGLRSSAKLTKHGKRRDERPLSAGQVYHIIRNPIYVGEIHGKGKTYPGQHEPIISREIWERAVAISASRENETPHNKETDHFLAGLLWDDCGRHMLLATDWYRGKCYFRYASSNANWSRREFRRAYRCNAGRLDQFALSSVAEFLCDRLVLRAALKKLGVYGKELDDLVSKGEEAADRLTNLPVRELEAVFAALLVRVEIGHEHIDFTFRSLELRRFLRWKGSTKFRPRKAEWALSEATFVHEVAATIVSCERIPVINLAPRDRSKCLTPNEELVQLLNKARSAQQLIDQHRDVEIRKLAAVLGCRPAHFSRLLRLNYLAPDIVTAILDGVQPKELTCDTLFKSNLPLDWSLQRRLFGFTQVRRPDRVQQLFGRPFNQDSSKGEEG